MVEAYDATPEQTLNFYEYEGKSGANMPFNVALVSLEKDCDAECVSKQIHTFLDVVGMDTKPDKWPNWQVSTE